MLLVISMLKRVSFSKLCLTKDRGCKWFCTSIGMEFVADRYGIHPKLCIQSAVLAGLSIFWASTPLNLTFDYIKNVYLLHTLHSLSNEPCHAKRCTNQRYFRIFGVFSPCCNEAEASHNWGHSTHI